VLKEIMDYKKELMAADLDDDGIDWERM